MTDPKKKAKIVELRDSLLRDYRKAVTHYKQQKQPAWRPYFTVWTVVPTFLIVALVVIVLGVGFLYADSELQHFSLDYTDCQPLYGTRSCAEMYSSWNRQGAAPKCVCWYRFRLEEHFEKNVYLYYSLFNFYQNHRRYAHSLDLDQWRGRKSASDDCDPIRYKTLNGTETPIVPCGVIANSFFNDTFEFWYRPQFTNGTRLPVVPVPLSRTHLTWHDDFERGRNARDPTTFPNFTNPPYWGDRTAWDLNPTNPENNGLRFEPLIVWMRVAAFPDFMKLYARINHNLNEPDDGPLGSRGKMFLSGLPAGDYFLRIAFNFPVSAFHGRKSVILTNTNKILGNSYQFLGIVYLGTGICVAISGIALLILYCEYGVSREESFDIHQGTSFFFERNGSRKSLHRR